MAIVCPQCLHIHFATQGSEAPNACSQCQAELQGTPPEQSKPKFRRRRREETPTVPSGGEGGVHVPTIIAGIVLAFAGICLGIIGKQKYDEYGTATVTVRVQKVVDRVSDLGFVKYTYYRYDSSASYSVNGRSYPFKLETSEFKWDYKDGEKFDITYHQDAPATPVKSRPTEMIFVGGLLILFGIGLVIFALKVHLGSPSPQAVPRPQESVA